ncbi:MAG: ATP-binding cassette domain-containing protein, partial [Clostridia bacterium]|nr:ATP-binding cassette domain-containing protein [Clostridia bacterium]
MSSLIKAENVCFSFKDEDNITKVLRDFNLTIKKGSFVSILGHNGSGKSTLARLFNCLYQPDAGVITVDGLLKGLLIASGNDAAAVLASRVSGSTENFVTLMNS